MMSVGCAGAPGPAATPATLAAPIPAVSTAAMDAHLKYLADDLLEGRAPATRGGRLAAKYIAAQFEALGLEPAGSDGSYFQPVALVGMTPHPSLVWGKGGATRSLAYLDDFVAWAERPESHIVVDGEVVFVGYGIEAGEWQWDDYKSAEVRGKVLLMLVNDPGLQDSTIFNGRALTYYGRWTYKLEEAARRGAAGAILHHTAKSATYGWDVVGGAIQARPAGRPEHRIRRVGDTRRRSSRARTGRPQPRFADPCGRAPPVSSGDDRHQRRGRGHERAASRPLGERRGQDPRGRPRAGPPGGVVHGALGSQRDRPRRERRLDLQRRGGQCIGCRGDARCRRGAGSGATPAPADAPVRGDHRRGERFARQRGVHAGSPGPARADGGGDQSRCDQRSRRDARHRRAGPRPLDSGRCVRCGGSRGIASRGARARCARLVLSVGPFPLFKGRRASAVDRARQGLRRPPRRLGSRGGRALQPRALPPTGRRVSPDLQLRGDGAGGSGGAASRARGGERAGDAALASEFGIPAACRACASLSAICCSICKLLSINAM